MHFALHERKFRPAGNLRRTVHTLAGDARAQIIGRVALSLIAISIDIAIVPSMYSARPFFTLSAFAALVWMGGRQEADSLRLPRLSMTRLVVFAGLHSLLICAGYHLAPGLSAVAQSDSTSAPFASAAKILLVLPTLVLFPIFSGFFRRYESAIIATGIVLLTYFPGRYFQLIWPWYSQALGRIVAVVAHAFVPGTNFDAATLTVVGSSLDMEIAFTCSGITGINLFHLVFGLIVILEWNRINRGRALICYLTGGLVYMVANIIRLVILFLAGNLISPHLNLDLIGWLVFALTFYVLIKVTYGWMVPDRENEPLEIRALQKTA